MRGAGKGGLGGTGVRDLWVCGEGLYSGNRCFLTISACLALGWHDPAPREHTALNLLQGEAARLGSSPRLGASETWEGRGPGCFKDSPSSRAAHRLEVRVSVYFGGQKS